MEEREREMLLGKIEEWQSKARFESDPFNKYVSIFIAYNIFYNLYEKTEHPSADLTYGDNKRAIATISLVTDGDQLLHSIDSDLKDYLEIIPVFREEYWPTKRARKRVAISRTLKEAVKNGDAEKAVEMLLKWLYKVRCNLVHGEKGYNDEMQKRLLAKSSLLLDKVLQHFIESYREVYVGR